MGTVQDRQWAVNQRHRSLRYPRRHYIPCTATHIHPVIVTGRGSPTPPVPHPDVIEVQNFVAKELLEERHDPTGETDLLQRRAGAEFAGKCLSVRSDDAARVTGKDRVQQRLGAVYEPD